MIRPLALLGLVALGLTACDRPKSAAPDHGSAASTNTTLSSPSRSGEVLPPADYSTIHWLGKMRFAGDTNAAAVMAIWNLPESAKLGAQTLDKLSLAPWRLLKNDAATNGAPAAQLRPLLEDLITREILLAFHHPTNSSPSWSLAVKLPAGRVGLWQTNLAAVFESLAGAKPHPTPGGFSITYGSSILSFVPRHANDWTVLICELSDSKSETRSADLETLKAQLSTLNAQPSPTNWLSLDLDLAALNRAFGFGWSLPANCPRVKLQAVGSGQAVQSLGRLTFALPPRLNVQPWNIPTNLVTEPLMSFTAVRGIEALWGCVPFLQNIPVRQLPDQFCFWSLSGMPQLTFFGCPHPDTNLIAHLSERMLQQGGSWIPDASLGSLRQSAAGAGVELANTPFLPAFIQATNQPGGDFLFAGLFPHAAAAAASIPDPLLSSLVTATNQLAYDWELSGPRLESLTYLGQLVRLVFGHEQLRADGAALPWLRAVAPHLGNSVTRALLVDPNHIVLSRNSTVGFTSLELQLLLDWLESSEFPRLVHSRVEPSANPPPSSGQP